MRLHLLAAGALLSCAAPAPRAPVPAVQLSALHLTPPAGTVLAETCEPSGPEQCFNAIDDNCNGIIDEGCGEQSGLLQFTIAWGAVPADVNLTLVLPDASRVPNGKVTTAESFTLDRDCPGSDTCRDQNVENIFYDGDAPPRGHYTVDITLADPRGVEGPIAVRFGARLGQRTVGFDVSLAPGDDAQKTFSFDLP